MIRDYDYPKSSLLAQVLEELISKEYIKLLYLRTNEILNDYIVNVYYEGSKIIVKYIILSIPEIFEMSVEN